MIFGIYLVILSISVRFITNPIRPYGNLPISDIGNSVCSRDVGVENYPTFFRYDP